MTAKQIITWIAYNWEFVGVGVTLIAVAYGGILDAREARVESVARADASVQQFSSRGTP